MARCERWAHPGLARCHGQVSFPASAPEGETRRKPVEQV